MVKRRNPMTTKIKMTTALRAGSLLMVAALFALLAVPSASAADIIKADITFPFQVSKKSLPAGNYEFRINYVDEMVNVVNSSNNDGVIATFLTYLAPPPHSSATDAHLVFDKVGNTYTLSELWEPGRDGVLVYATKGKHEHHIIHVKR